MTNDDLKVWRDSARWYDGLLYHWSEWGFLYAAMGSVFSLLGLVIALCLWGSAVSCAKLDAQMDAHTRWGFWTGCMVQTSAGWVPLENYRVLAK